MTVHVGALLLLAWMSGVSVTAIPDAQRRVNSVTLVHEILDFTGLTENPLSLGGRVTNGGTVGIDWQNFRSTSGFGAYGVGSQTPPPYADCCCAIAPPSGVAAWGRNQRLISQVRLQNKGSLSGFHELEHLSRIAITANNVRAYEFIYSVGPTDYIEMVIWKGPIGTQSPVTNNPDAFVSLVLNNSTAPSIQDADWCMSVTEGTILSAWHKVLYTDPWVRYAIYDTKDDLTNGVAAKWDEGEVGMGHWDNGDPGNFDDYAWRGLEIATT